MYIYIHIGVIFYKQLYLQDISNIGKTRKGYLIDHPQLHNFEQRFKLSFDTAIYLNKIYSVVPLIFIKVHYSTF